MVELVLASTSPRRRALLHSLGVPFQVAAPDIDETPSPAEAPVAFARRMAAGKGAQIAPRFPEAVVLAADTVVYVDGEILGKPGNRATAVRMLRRLSGRMHLVYTAVAMVRRREPALTEVDETRVWFRELSLDEVDRYVVEESVLDKAGGYAIQGPAGDFVVRLAGNYSNVVGLPLPVVYDLLRQTELGF